MATLITDKIANIKSLPESAKAIADGMATVFAALLLVAIVSMFIACLYFEPSEVVAVRELIFGV